MSFRGMRVTQTRMVLILALVLFPHLGMTIEISNRYRSPRNPERQVRASTELIVLHTTEAPARSSLAKLSDRGEAHFCVTEVGQVYRIVDLYREAFHAGRSMWNGKEDVDKFSIGIECVGYHDKAMPSVQISAIRELVKELQKKYAIPDERVVCHSHVAYGSPNKWQRHRHRGRKRCGMLFAMASTRQALGLKSRPAFDPDTRARRLVVGDDYLRKVLYGNVDTMRVAYGGGRTVPAPASSGGWFSRLVGNKTAASTPKPAVRSDKTAVTRAKSSGGPPKSVAELKARGYALKGVVSKTQTALKIAGAKWNAADTYYTIRDKIIPGSAINAGHIEKGMCVWMKK